jgi:predicted aspartyl protease
MCPMPMTKGKKDVGRFSVEIDVANYRDLVAVDLGRLKPDKVRRTTIRGVVDSGASQLVLPGTVAKQLGLPKGARVKVRYADGRGATRDSVDDVYVELLGRHGTFTAIVEPKREQALIGAIVLEAFDLLPDCARQRLVPRDPDFIVSEIE